MRNISVKKLAFMGVMTAMAFIFGWLESLLPSFTGIPGVKAGFANIITMTVIFLPDEEAQSAEQRGTLITAIAISLIRVILGGITYNGLSAMLYGLLGALFSLFIMYFLIRLRVFSVTAISVAGGVCHNAAQLALACILLSDAVFYYLPFLIISGIISGAVIGIISSLVIKRLSGLFSHPQGLQKDL